MQSKISEDLPSHWPFCGTLGAGHLQAEVPSLVASVGQAERFGKEKSFSFQNKTFNSSK